MILMLGLPYVYPLPATAATGMYVNAKADIILREQPKKNAAQLGTISNHSKITVLSSTESWSYVQAGKKKGYVYTSSLSKKNPKATASKVTGGLAPKDGLILTYEPSFLEPTKETFYVKKEDDYTYLYNKKSPLYPDLSNFTYIEGSKRLLMGVSSSDFIFVNIPYPLKQGASVVDSSMMFEEQMVLVESTTKSVTVKAGTFENAVVLKYPNGARGYFVKGIGIVKSTDPKGKVITELVKVEDGR